MEMFCILIASRNRKIGGPHMSVNHKPGYLSLAIRIFEIKPRYLFFA